MVVRGGGKSKGGVHRGGGINDVVERFVGLMVAGGNTSWERMSGSAMRPEIRAGFCHWRRDSVISILQILTPNTILLIVLASMRLDEYSSTGKRVSGSWWAT